MTNSERMLCIPSGAYFSDYEQVFLFKEAKSNGHVIIELARPLPASVRGSLLLDLEEYLKTRVDPGITVWLAPLGDKNSLRNLRGIEMK